nr:hypothetical protein [Armatimonas sp.]
MDPPVKTRRVALFGEEMMSEVKEARTKKTVDLKVLFLILGIMGLIALIINLPREAEKPEVGYYTGPKYNFRNGLFVDGNGKVVPPPPGVQVPEKAELKNTAKETD